MSKRGLIFSFTFDMVWIYQLPDQLEGTLADVLGCIITDKPVLPGMGIIHQAEGVDLLPAKTLMVSIPRDGQQSSRITSYCSRTLFRYSRRIVSRLMVFTSVTSRPPVFIL